MDHQHLHPQHQSGSTVSSIEDKDHQEAFHDEPQISPRQAQHDDTTNTATATRDVSSLRPLHLDTPLTDDDDDGDDDGLFANNNSRDLLSDGPPPLPPYNNNAAVAVDPSLPLVLKLLFGLNGLSLSLLTLPIMYILNTRVAVPLSYLPAYGAIAFLPYSLKPMYAYLCGVWATTKQQPSNGSPPRSDGNYDNNNTIESSMIQNQRNNNHNQNHHYRYLSLFRWLLACNSLCTLLFATIPKGGSVVAVFVVAFLRGVSDSWAEFCLGLTLIDHARLGMNVDSGQSHNYQTTVSGFQAQAATAGNLGAWLASLITCLVLVGRRFASEHEHEHENDDGTDHHQQPQLTGGIANGLVIVTALVQLGGAVFVHVWEKRESALSSYGDAGDGTYEELPTEARHPIHHNATPLEESFEPCISTESDSLRDDERSHPSYSSLEDLSDDDDDDDESGSPSTEVTSGFRTSTNPSRSPKKIANLAIVILLQCVLVAIALKGPIVEVSSHYVWGVLVTTFLVGILTAAITLCCKLGNNNTSNSSSNAKGYHDADATTFRVGLFLVLKNAIPSDSAILASFFYSLFGTNQPLLLQLLSFLGMGVSSLSSWSYTRFFSHRFGSGRPLVGLMAGTVALASLASLLHVAVFRVYQKGEADNDEEDEDGETSSSLPSRNLLLIAIVSKFVTTFFDEWAFLPELVLATTSVRVPNATRSTSTSATSSSPSPLVTIEDREAATQSASAIVVSIIPNHDHSCGNNDDVSDENDDDDDQKQRQRIAMEYGTLVSCIDFGDQLGSLVAAPLVAFWQISRENGFLHLDRLIIFCAVANVAITIGLLPLLWNITSEPKTKR